MPYVGQSLKRFEDHRLLTGQGQFLDDLTFPGLLHAVVLRSPHAHAVLTSLEVTAARQAPGVVAVVTATDLDWQTVCAQRGDAHPERCPTCGQWLVCTGVIPRGGAPPRLFSGECAA